MFEEIKESESMIKELLQKIEIRKFRVGIVGLGYVGLPLALCFSEEGFDVVGLDVDESKINILNAGGCYIKHMDVARVAAGIKSNITVTTDFSKCSEVDAIIICVPTPLSKHREPDMSFINSTVDSILPYLKKNQLVSLESTTYPGTTEEIIKPRIESKGFTVGEDIYLSFSPEREDPGNERFNTKTIPKIVGADTEACKAIAVKLYSVVIDKIVSVSSTRAAELTKLLENIHRAVNIGLVNEMKIIADAMGLDIYEVIDAAATKPFGFVPYYPGPGLGGHCIPIDPFYLTWKAKEYGVNTKFIELAGEVNTSMPLWVYRKVSDGLNSKGLSVNGSKILVVGIAYKKNVDDMRESPSVEIMEILRRNGAVVSYHDSWVPVFPKMREHSFDLASVDLTAQNLKGFDLVLIATNHDCIDYDLILEKSNIVVDTRGVYRTSAANLIKS